jgi:hypothetical protein
MFGIVVALSWQESEEWQEFRKMALSWNTLHAIGYTMNLGKGHSQWED